MTIRKIDTTTTDLLVQARDRRNASWAKLAKQLFQAPERAIPKVHLEPREKKAGLCAHCGTQSAVNPLMAKGHFIS